MKHLFKNLKTYIGKKDFTSQMEICKNSYFVKAYCNLYLD